MAKRDPFGNRIKEIMKWKATDELTPMTIVDGFAASISWDLPPAYCCVIRADYPDGKVKEKAYKNAKAAQKFMKLCIAEDADFTLMTEDTLRDTGFYYEDEYDESY
tara:strand:- start:516 stop:833 length:318 start_codon:yes stop_codon:yes gene_type:complete